jgi:hypothetical protein
VRVLVRAVSIGARQLSSIAARDPGATCWNSIEGNEVMAIDDGEAMKVAARVKAVEQLTADGG